MSLRAPEVDIAELSRSWKVALQAEKKSPQTVASYTLGLDLFLRWCTTHGHPHALDRNLVRAWIAGMLDDGASPATARARQMALKRFSAWLAAEDEIDTDPLRDLSPPKMDRAVVDSLTDAQSSALVAACKGKDFLDRRDEAVVRLFIETGMRAAELLGLVLDDVDVNNGVAVVRRGKGAKGRVVPFGPQTASAIDRYLRIRRRHPRANTPALWLGGGGQGLGYHGLDVALKKRAAAAGITGFHIHRLRHTAATRWLAAGGSEQNLMAVAGWSSRSMLDRYTAATASERAAAESRRLNLGDL